MAYLTPAICDSFTSEHLETLNKVGIWTTNDLFSADLSELKRSSNIRLTVLKDLREKIAARYAIPCNDSYFVFHKYFGECKMVPTGLPELTQALDGGFQTQELVELFGESGCGKTELCFLLCGEILSHFNDYHILYVASNHDIDIDKIAKYTRFKAGRREFTDEMIFNCLNRIQVARPTRLADLVHLLNTFAHSERRSLTKCIIIDSLTFIIQEDILQIKSSDPNNPDDLEKFSALDGKSFHFEVGATVESKRKYFIDIYLHEVMRLLTNISISQNVIVVITNSDQNLSFSKSWTNAIDHRIRLTEMPKLSRYCKGNLKSSVRIATIVKTIHNITKVGYSVKFAINDEGLVSIRS